MTTRQIPKYSIVMVINRVVFQITRILAKPKLKAWSILIFGLQNPKNQSNYK